MTTPAPPADKKTATKTAYHVFGVGGEFLPGARDPDVDVTSFEPGGTYTIIARNVEAQSPAAAIRKHVESVKDGHGGTFVAVPARSWRPVKVTVEQQTVVKVGDA